MTDRECGFNTWMENVWQVFARSYVFIPLLGSALVLGLVLLFFRDIDPSMRIILVPALVVYIIGTSVIGYLYTELDIINCVRARNNNEPAGPQPWYICWIFRIAYAVWFAFLVLYLFCKGVLRTARVCNALNGGAGLASGRSVRSGD